jgi:thymidylate kinase
MVIKEKKSQRQEFIEKLFRAHLSGSKYGLMRCQNVGLEQIDPSSDLDIAIDLEDYNGVILKIISDSLVQNYVIRKRSFMHFIELYFHDKTFLEIDFIWKFKYKNVTIMSMQEVLNSTYKDHLNVQRVAPQHDAEFTMLFYQLNRSPIPQKYKSVVKQNLTYLADKYPSLQNGLDVTPSTRQSIISSLNSRFDNKGFEWLKNLKNYVKDSLESYKDFNTPSLTFSGVDGAGKTTIIDAIERLLTEKYRKKVVRVRHRPSLIPILSAFVLGKKKAEQKAANTLPRQGKNNSVLSSSFRFFYYYVDYLLGGLYLYLRHTLQGHVILYDRYYFDFILDAKRSNINLPSKLIKALYSPIKKHDINLFLYAKPEVILSRKQELSAEVILKLTTDYKALFADLQKKHPQQAYTPIENIELDESLLLIEALLIERLRARQKKADT